MESPPNVHDTTIVETLRQEERTLAGSIRKVRASPVKRSVKDGVEITEQNGGNGRVNLASDVLNKLIPRGIPVRGISTCDPKGLTIRVELNQSESAVWVDPRIVERKRVPKKNSNPARVIGPRRDHSLEAKGRKPREGFISRDHVSLLQTNNVQGQTRQPLE